MTSSAHEPRTGRRERRRRESSATGPFVVALVAGDLTWGYRRMRCADDSVQVREVYTRRDGTVAGWVDGPVALLAADEDDLAETHRLLAAAFTEPVLVETDLPGYRP